MSELQYLKLTISIFRCSIGVVSTLIPVQSLALGVYLNVIFFSFF